jgi:hypothetical protein
MLLLVYWRRKKARRHILSFQYLPRNYLSWYRRLLRIYLMAESVMSVDLRKLIGKVPPVIPACLVGMNSVVNINLIKKDWFYD